jgi:hypothetical protein
LVEKWVSPSCHGETHLCQAAFLLSSSATPRGTGS